MKKIINGVLGVLFLLLISATAHATLSDNLLVNGDFTGTTITDSKTGGLLSNGVWYGSAENWDWRMDAGGNPGAYAALENKETAYLFQAVNLSGLVATAGEVSLSIDYKLNKLLSPGSVTLYGSDSQPSVGSYGDILVDYTGFNLAKDWNGISLEGNAASGYEWYTLVIYGAGAGAPGANFSVDNVNVRVTATPIPAAVWLLGSGLVGLGIVRRKWMV